MMPPIFQNMGRIMQMVGQIRSNPSFASQLLLQQGKITNQQYNEIQQLGIGNNPQAIGQYLMNHGIMNSQQADMAKQQYADPIKNSMGQN